jgi:hypothetical protein
MTTRSREGMRLAVQLFAGASPPPNTGKLTSFADAISEWLEQCAPDGTAAGDFEELNRKLEELMSEDAAIQAVNADITTQLTTLSGLISQVLTEIQNNTVQPSTVSALQAEQANLDQIVAGFGTSLNPPASTGTSAPAAPAS